LPMGQEHDGEMNGVSVSPDGRLIAASGTDAYSKEHDLHFIYVFDSASGATLRRFGPTDEKSIWNAFSPDGRFLAAAAEHMIVFEVATGREVMRDREFDDSSTGVEFGPDGTLFAVGYDGYVRRYSAGNFSRTAKVAISGHPRLQSVAVDSAGRRVAVGVRGAARIEILDAANLRRVASADMRGIQDGDELDQVGWFRNGKLVAGGTFKVGSGRSARWAVRTWDADGRRVGSDRAVADDLITSITRCGEDLYLTTGDPPLLRLKVNG